MVEGGERRATHDGFVRGDDTNVGKGHGVRNQDRNKVRPQMKTDEEK